MNEKDNHLNLQAYRLGFAVNHLLSEIETEWFGAAVADIFPERINAHLSVVLSTLDRIEPHLSTRANPKAIRLREALKKTIEAVRSAWMNEKHQSLVELLIDIRPDVLRVEDWQRLSPLATPEMQDLREAAEMLVSKFKEMHQTAYTAGALMSQVLNLDDSVLDESADETNPVPRLEEQLIALQTKAEALKRLDLRLFDDASDATTLYVRRIHQRAEKLHGLVLDRLGKAIKTQKPRMSVIDANPKVRRVLIKNPRATQREIAKKIGCSHGTVGKSEAWKAVQAQLKSGRAPKAVSLTNLFEVTLNENDRQRRLAIAESNRENDRDVSPLNDDATIQPREQKRV